VTNVLAASSGSSARLDVGVRRARLLALGLIALQVSRFSANEFTIDDAWISFRTARNLVEHGVLTYDVTQPPVEGVTNLSWTLLSAAGQALFPAIEPVLLARAFGAVCVFTTAWLAVGVAAQFAGRARPGSQVTAAFVTAILLGTAGNVAYHSVSGLESGLYLLLWVASLDAVLARSPGRLAACVSLMAATRPEGVLLGALTLALAAGEWGVRQVRGPVFAWLTALAAIEGFRLIYFGALVPNTFHAKPPSPHLGWMYLGRFLTAVGFAGPLAAAVGAWHSRSLARTLLIAGVMVVGATWSGGDWMAGYRRLLDAYVVLAIGGGVGVALVRSAAAPALAMVAGSAWMAFSGRDSAAYSFIAEAQVGALLGDTPGVNTVAALDIGCLGWYYPGAIVDLAGLTDRTLASTRDKAARQAYFAARNPDVVLIVSEAPMAPGLTTAVGVYPSESDVLTWVAGTHRYGLRQVIPLRGGSFLNVINRDDVDLPVDRWGRWP